MIRHLFKLIWNKKKQNFLLIMEMLVSFMVMFAVFSLLVFYYTNYKRPMGFVYEDVWALTFNNNRLDVKAPDSIAMYYENIKRRIASFPEVRSVSYVSGNSPFSANTTNSNIEVNKATFSAHIYRVDDDYAKTLQVTLLAGRWFSKLDDAGKEKPIILNRKMKELAYGDKDAIGQRFRADDKDVVVIGVVETLKDKGDYNKAEAGYYMRAGRSSEYWPNRLLISLQPGTSPVFESKINKAMAGIMPEANIEIEQLTKKRVTKNNLTLIPMLMLLIVAGFLIVNVALGLFGVLWYNISRRKAEIGLRRAIGATGGNIVSQIVSETLVLSTFSLIIGSFFAIQFPLLNVFDLPSGVYISALVLAILFIYVLVIICAIYPGKQASNILPAVALHED
ncbi:ABC transporter permease [Chitinophaga niabensis]|uniref:Putative ABC transport system permease protein n=1 Tax=Chitinophaga niabensis TaxID=536979 RepID=A0A1N6EM44_9BACT|nr:FtsX-like permease family protein [Chitinophaga niabensis]SIN84116.1 putative ABC transport system permease protein [Chitinophaga niabensis]